MDDAAQNLYESQSREYLGRSMLGRFGVEVKFPATIEQVMGVMDVLGYPVSQASAIAIMQSRVLPTPAARPTDDGRWPAAAVVELLATVHGEGRVPTA